METSEAARTVRRGRATKAGRRWSWSEHVCVCHRVSFSRSVVMFGALFVCWIVWTRASLCHVDHSSPPPLSPLHPPLLHLCLLSSSLISLHIYLFCSLLHNSVFYYGELSDYYRYQTHTHSVGGEMLWDNTSIFLVFFPSSVRSVVIPSIVPRFCDFLLSFLLCSSHHYSYIHAFCPLVLLSPSVLSYVLSFTLKLLINMLGSFPSS